MAARVVPGSANRSLAFAIAAALDTEVAPGELERFPDGELRPTVAELIGDVTGRSVVIVDDMISTGTTIEAAIAVVLAHAGAEDLTVAATHGLLVAGAVPRMTAAGAGRVLVTDTQAVPAAASVEVCSVAPLLADAIRRLHDSEPLDDLLHP